MRTDTFSRMFRAEHQAIHEGLQDLLTAFHRRDPAVIRPALWRVSSRMMPHIRYEADALYPALFESAGPHLQDWVIWYQRDHHQVAAGGRKLQTLARRPRIEDKDIVAADLIISSILPRVEECNDLTQLIAGLPDRQVRRIMESREEALRAGCDADGEERGWDATA